MGKSGEASILAVADVSKFAQQLQKGIQDAIKGIKIDASPIGDQIAEGVKKGVEDAKRELSGLSTSADAEGQKVQASTKKTSASVAAMFSKLGGQLSSVGQTMSVAVTLPIAAVATQTFKTAGDFEQAMNRVRAGTEATGTQFDNLRKQAISLGSTTQFSATDAANAMYILASAGFSTTGIMESLPGVLNLAAAGMVDIATASDIASGILNGFGLKATEIGRVDDVLTKAFLATATSLQDLGESFKYVGPVANSAGMSFEETAAAIGLMGNAGIKGSEAGTALRGALAAMLKPSKLAENTLRAIGVTVVDAHGKLLPLVDIIGQLGKAGASTADMMAIFGIESGPGMMALVSQGAGALQSLTGDLRNAGGTADRVAKIQMQGLNGALDNLSSSAEGLMIAIGDAGLLAILTRLVDKATALLSRMAALPPPILAVGAAVAAFLAALGPALFMIGKLAESIGFIIPIITKIGEAFAADGVMTAAFTGPIGWVVLALIALGAGAVIAYNKIEAFRNVVDAALSAVGAAAIWLWQSAIQPAWTWIQSAAAAVGGAFLMLWRQAEPAIMMIGQAMSTTWGAIRPAVMSLGSALAGFGSAVASAWSSTIQPAVSSLVGWFGRLFAVIGAWWSANGAGIFAAAGAAIAWFWTGIVNPALTGIINVVRIVAQVLTWAFVTIIVPAIQIVVGAIRILISIGAALFSALVPILSAVAATAMRLFTMIATSTRMAWTVIGPVLAAIGTALMWVWSSILVPLFGLVKNVIEGLVGVIMWLWSNAIAPLLSLIVPAIKILGAIILWLWNNIVDPAIAAIAAILTGAGTIVLWLVNNIAIPAFKGLGAIFGFLWTVVSTAFSAIGAIISGAGAVIMWLWHNAFGPAMSAIGALIGGVVAVAMWFYNTFGPIIMAVGNLVWTVVSGIVMVAFTLLKFAFTAVVVLVQFWAGVIMGFLSQLGAAFLGVWNAYIWPFLQWIGSGFSWLWTAAIQPALNWIMSGLSAIGAFFVGLWNTYIWPFLQWIGSGFSWLWTAKIQPALNWIMSGWNMLTSALGVLWSYIQVAITNIGLMWDMLWATYMSPFINAVVASWNWLVGVASAVWSAIVGAVKSAVTGISNTASSIAGFVNNASAHFQNLVNSIREKIDTAASFVKGLPGRCLDALGNAGRMLWDAGSRIVQGLIDGIESKIGALKSKMSGVASSIRDFLPFSPAKIGPLSGHGDPTISGGKIVRMIAAGMDSQLPALQSAAAAAAAAAGGLNVGAGPGMSSINAAIAAANAPRGGDGAAAVVFGPGSVVVSFAGPVTQDEAYQAGMAVGSGIAGELRRTSAATLVRGI